VFTKKSKELVDISSGLETGGGFALAILGLVSQRIANARCKNGSENQSSGAGTVAISASQIRLFLKKADRELQNTISK
jgi:hypothetical protein